MTHLKPCPFCGRAPRESDRAASDLEGGRWVAFIACMCGGYSARAHQGATGVTAEEAKAVVAQKWNTRATNECSEPVETEKATLRTDVMETIKERTAPTEGPWRVDPAYPHIVTTKGRCDIAVCRDCNANAEANAALIVKAVNSFPKLVEALKYYANPETHKSRVLGTEWGAPIETDKGEIARAALSEGAAGGSTE